MSDLLREMSTTARAVSRAALDIGMSDAAVRLLLARIASQQFEGEDEFGRRDALRDFMFAQWEWVSAESQLGILSARLAGLEGER
jgi:hypothetical protein